MTDAVHGAATIVDVRPDRVRSELAAGAIVLVAGVPGRVGRLRGDDARPGWHARQRNRARRGARRDRAASSSRTTRTAPCETLLPAVDAAASGTTERMSARSYGTCAQLMSRAAHRRGRRHRRCRHASPCSCSRSAATATCGRSRRRDRRAARVAFGDDELVVEEATPEALGAGDLDLCLFSVGTSASRELVPHASAGGAVCVDKSSAYRLVDGYPLVVPEVNGARALEALERDRIVANPNCCTIPLTCVLKPLHDQAGLTRVRVATYQSVSGGRRTAYGASCAPSRRPSTTS